MKTLVLLLAAGMNLWQPRPEIAQALRGAKALKNLRRDPDSFVVERVFTWSKKDDSRDCYIYRSHNGYGGMTREIGYYVEHNGKSHATPNAATRMFPTCPKQFTEITAESTLHWRASDL